MHPSESIGLVACSSRKRPGTHPARDLYNSALFMKSKAWVTAHCKAWYILSAQYGLLQPDQLVASYDLTLSRLTTDDRRAWAHRVNTDLRQLDSASFVLLAGNLYASALEGLPHERPMHGLSIGQQLRWLSTHLTPSPALLPG